MFLHLMMTLNYLINGTCSDMQMRRPGHTLEQMESENNYHNSNRKEDIISNVCSNISHATNLFLRSSPKRQLQNPSTYGPQWLSLTWHQMPQIRKYRHSTGLLVCFISICLQLIYASIPIKPFSLFYWVLFHWVHQELLEVLPLLPQLA